MNIKLNGMTINIIAKLEFKHHYSKAETMSFLNLLACITAEASRSYKRDGFNALAEEARRMANDIHSQLATLGYYDK